MAVRTLTVTPGPGITRDDLTATQRIPFGVPGLIHNLNGAQRPAYRFKMTLGPLTKRELDYITAFHAEHKGGRSFMWDGGHYGRQDTLQRVGEGDGGNREFYLPVRHVNPASVQVQVTQGGYGAASITTAFSLNSNPGLICFDTAPSSGDTVEARWANLYRCLFHQEGIQPREVAANLYALELELVEVVQASPEYSTLNYGLVEFWNMDEGEAYYSTLNYGLAAFWNLDETGSVERADVLGRSNLLVVNTVTSTVGWIGNGALFDQANSFGALYTAGDSHFQFANSAEFTIAMILNCTSFRNSDIIIDNCAPGPTPSWVIANIISPNRYFFALIDSGGGQATAFSPPVVVDTTNIIFGFYDSRSGCCFQMNTSLSVVSAGPIHRFSNVNTISVGLRLSTPDTRGFHGLISAVGIWGRRLTELERTEFYNLGAGRQHPFES